MVSDYVHPGILERMPAEYRKLVEGLDQVIWHLGLNIDLREYYDAVLDWYDGDDDAYDHRALQILESWKRDTVRAAGKDMEQAWGYEYWEKNMVLEIIGGALSDDTFVYGSDVEKLRILVDALLPPVCPTDRDHEVYADPDGGWYCKDCGRPHPLKLDLSKYRFDRM